MELIKEICGIESQTDSFDFDTLYKIRKAARAVVLNKDNKIAILYVSKDNYHKLPGGGVEENENIIEALNREILEEVGANIKVLKEVGVIIEYRKLRKPYQLQISYCYIAKVDGDIVRPSFTDNEIKDGFKLKWVDLEQAIELLKQDKPSSHLGKYIKQRDIAFLLKAREMLGNVG